MIDGKKIAVIHIAKAQLGLGDEEYRDILESACGVRSAKDISDEAEFKAVMNMFHSLGVESRKGSHRLNTRQWYKAMWLWGELHKIGACRHPNEAALRAFVHKISPHGDTTEGMSRVIEHLKQWFYREKRARDYGNTGTGDEGQRQLIRELLEVLENAGYDRGTAVVMLRTLTSYKRCRFRKIARRDARGV